MWLSRRRSCPSLDRPGHSALVKGERKWNGSVLNHIFKLLYVTQHILQYSQGKPQVPYNCFFVKASSYEIRSLGCLQGLWQRRDMKTSSFLWKCYSQITAVWNMVLIVIHLNDAQQTIYSPFCVGLGTGYPAGPQSSCKWCNFLSKWAHRSAHQSHLALWRKHTRQYIWIRQVLNLTAINIYTASADCVLASLTQISTFLFTSIREETWRLIILITATQSESSQPDSFWQDSTRPYLWWGSCHALPKPHCTCVLHGWDQGPTHRKSESAVCLLPLPLWGRYQLPVKENHMRLKKEKHPGFKLKCSSVYMQRSEVFTISPFRCQRRDMSKLIISQGKTRNILLKKKPKKQQKKTKKNKQTEMAPK